MRSLLDYAGFAQLCGKPPIMRKIMRAHNRIIPRSLMYADFDAGSLSYFRFRAQTDRHTDRHDWMPYPMLATIQPLWVIN